MVKPHNRRRQTGLAGDGLIARGFSELAVGLGETLQERPRRLRHALARTGGGPQLLVPFTVGAS